MTHVLVVIGVDKRTKRSGPCMVVSNTIEGRQAAYRYIYAVINGNMLYSQYKWENTESDIWECEHYAFRISLCAHLLDRDMEEPSLFNPIPAAWDYCLDGPNYTKRVSDSFYRMQKQAHKTAARLTKEARPGYWEWYDGFTLLKE